MSTFASINLSKVLKSAYQCPNKSSKEKRMKLLEYGKIIPYQCCSWVVYPQPLVAGWGGR